MKYINNFMVGLGLIFACNATVYGQLEQKKATSISKYVSDTAKVDFGFQK